MRTLLLILSTLVAFSTQAVSQKPIVVSSASMIWDMVNVVGGDLVDSKLLVPIGGDPHTYEPTPKDAQLIESADLIFVNGLTFEGWINELIENSGTKAKVITVTDRIQAIQSSEYKNSYDPHAWMDATKGFQYIQNIRRALIEYDPSNEETYFNNYRGYYKKLKKLDKYIFDRISEIPEKQRLLVTSHDAFSYYGKRYGLRVEGIVGISTEAEAQTSDLVRVVKAIKETNVPAIFVESTVNPKLINQIAKDNQLSIGGSLYADSIGEEGSEGDSYYKMLKYNTDVIVDALKKEKPKTAIIQNSEDQQSSFWAYGLVGLLMLLVLLILILKLNK